VVSTAGDGFFEMMNGHSAGGRTRGLILRSRHTRSSETDREGIVHRWRDGRSSGDPVKEKYAVSGSPQDIHGSSTGFPHKALSVQLCAVRMVAEG
jgi:hypothetical protein